MSEKQGPPSCINLKDSYGDKYKIVWDECRRSHEMDPWLMQILCKFGHLFPHGDDTIAASIDGFTGIAGKVRRLAKTDLGSWITIHQDGDFGELTFLFESQDFEKAAEIMKPRKRVQYSPEVLEKKRASMAEYFEFTKA